MQKRMTITVDGVVYECVIDDLAAGYRAMAEDGVREQEALAWSEALIGDQGVLSKPDLKSVESILKMQLGLPG